MDNLTRLRLGTATLFSTLFVALSYEVKDSAAFEFIRQHVGHQGILAISVVLGSSLAPFATKLLLKLSLVRRLALGQSWIEGYWIQETFLAKNGNGETPVSTGIVQFTYTGQDLDLEVQVYHSASVHNNSESWSTTNLAVLRDTDCSYINYFTVRRLSGETTGVSVGRFFSSEAGFFRRPDSYSGKMTYFEKHTIFHQTLKRLSTKEVKQLKAQYGVEWKKAAIKKAQAKQC